MDKEFSPAPLNDQDLDALFAAAQRDAPQLDPEVLARLQAQAAAALPQVCGAPADGAVRYFGMLSQACRAIWRLAGGGGPGHGWGGGGGHRSQPAGCRVGHHQRLFPDREPE